MKKLGKLSINPSKAMKNEELVRLKGGYGGGYMGNVCWCYCGNSPCGSGILLIDSYSDCLDTCQDLYWDDGWNGVYYGDRILAD